MSFERIQLPRKMARIIFVVLCCVCLSLLESVNSLKCRTGVQQANDQFRNVLQICKKRYAGDNNYNDDFSSSDDDNNQNSLNINVLDKLFMHSGNKFSNVQSWKEENDNWDEQRNEQHYSNNMNGNGRNTQYRNHENNNDHDYGYYDAARSDYSQMYNGNSGNNYNKGREQACIVQCFFNELNMVDHRGFPEQNKVIQLMTHNIQNLDLHDFLEEAIIECFHYLSSDSRRDKCLYSQNLISCLADKGKERCEDWDN